MIQHKEFQHNCSCPAAEHAAHTRAKPNKQQRRSIRKTSATRHIQTLRRCSYASTINAERAWNAALRCSVTAARLPLCRTACILYYSYYAAYRSDIIIILLVKIVYRVYRCSVYADLEMAVVSCASSRAAYLSDHLSLIYLVAY